MRVGIERPVPGLCGRTPSPDSPAPVVALADTRTIQRRDGASLAPESVGVLGFEALDRDDTIDRVSRAFHTSTMPPAPRALMIS